MRKKPMCLLPAREVDDVTNADRHGLRKKTKWDNVCCAPIQPGFDHITVVEGHFERFEGDGDSIA